ncbi:MAG: M20 family peptidase [Deltaproteobacteria bacterium]|nr:MAG: M20 family peptidase [Deltaproteobacteria bacterium]
MVPREFITQVIDAVDGDEVVKLTAELVKINSVWDPEAGTCEQPAADHVLRWAEAQGFDTQMDEVAPGRSNVIVTYAAGPGERTLMFEGHTDVVTPGEISAWKYDPFGAEIVNGRMYGRGTNDTKGNLAAMLIAMAVLKRTGIPLAGSIVAGVLCDEEDQMLGVQDFIRRGHADTVTGAIICEPQDGMICTSQKGAIRARFTVTGRMSHGAMPLAGLNTAPAVACLIEGLQALEATAAETTGRDAHLGWPSFTPTVIQAPPTGAPQLNVMPSEAVLLVDIRTIPAQLHETIRTQLTALAADTGQRIQKHYEALNRRLGIDRNPRLGVSVEFLTDRTCTRTDPDDPVVKAADRATRAVWDIEPVYGGVPGATDGTFLWALKNIPIVTMGAGDREVPHQVDEWVDVGQLIDTARIYALSALNYLFPGAAE